MIPSDPGFRALLAVTLWLGGLLVALVTGMLSGYLLASLVFVGGKAYGRLRTAREAEGGRELGRGETG